MSKKSTGKDLAKKTAKDVFQETAEDFIGEMPFGKAILKMVKNFHEKSVNDRFEHWVDCVFDGTHDAETLKKMQDPEQADLLVGVLRRLQEDDESAKASVFTTSSTCSGTATRTPP